MPWLAEDPERLRCGTRMTEYLQRLTLSTDRPASERPLPPAITESWDRCEAAGVNRAANRMKFTRVPEEELERRLEANADWLMIAGPHAEWLGANYRHTEHVIWITDRHGIILHSAGSEWLRVAFGLSPGNDFSEVQVGTNPAGTAIAADEPLTVVGEQHFNAAFHNLTGTGAPLHAPDGTLIGAVAISSRVADGVSEPVAVLSHAAYAIGRELGYAQQEASLKRAERSLQESEASLKAILDNTQAIVYLMDPENRFLHINRHWQNVFGLTNERVAGRSIYEFFPQNAADEFRDNNRKVLESGSPLEFEEVVPHSDGPHTYITVKVPIYDSSGAPHAVCGISTDITDRKRIEQQREQAIAALNSFIASAPVGVAMFDGEMRYRLVNEPLAQMNGAPAADHIGKSVADMLPDLHAQVEPLFRRVIETGASVLDQIIEGETASCPGVKRTWRGSWFPVAGPDGRASGVGAIIHEITQQQRAEREAQDAGRYLEAVVETAPSLIVMADESGRIVLFNRACEVLTGYERQEVIGQSLLERFVPADWHDIVRARFADPHALALRDPHENPWLTKSGDRRLIEWRCTALHPVGDGGTYFVIGTGVDVTERRLLENELRRQAEELAEADRRKDEFLATLAHELRNPLAPIRTGLELMRIAADDRALIDTVRSTMQGQAEQLVRLVDDLLDVSRITSGRIRLRRERVELARVVRSAIDSTHPLIQECGHELSVTLPSQPVYLEADPTRLAQIISNLLTNAAKYTDCGGRIWLTVERRAAQVALTVRDTGIGIPAEMLDRIFDMFMQVDQSLEKSQSGLGVGLTLVKRLVEMHGGSVQVRSEGAGRGSEFSVFLPAPAGEVADQLPVDDVDDRQAGEHRILVVDDSRAALMMLEIMLTKMGHEIRTACNGLEALEVAAAFRPEIVVMDVGMPKLNGYDTARRLRAHAWGEDMFLVALTGWGQDEDRQRARDAGFDRHFVKPVDPMALRKLLAEYHQTRIAR